jgi:hypothetical protein
MNFWETVIFAIVVGIVSTLGVVVGARISRRGVREQLYFDHAAKIAEFRQAWINDLRNSMAEFQSIGIMENARETSNFFRTGTKIELLMNPRDKRYSALQTAMYDFFGATDITQR